MSTAEGTKARALREAKGLLQTFGFNGFSFQHVADLLGIKKPSLYDHFESKEELGKSLIEEYHRSFSEWTETISIFGPREKVGALFELFYKYASSSGKLCSMSAMTADYNSLPKSMRKPLSKMFQFQHAWLKQVIEEGQKAKLFRKDQNSEELADLVLASGLGSQLVARVSGDPEKVKRIKDQALKILDI